MDVKAQSKKLGMAAKAFAHTQVMEQYFKEDIEYSIDNTQLYDVDDLTPIQGDHFPTVLMDGRDVVSSILEFAPKAKKCCVLNFASFHRPGGGYLAGSMAQEEALCHESTLYSVLSEMEDIFYQPNEFNQNYGLYMNRLLYSPRITFLRDDKCVHCDVISCAAPNYTAFKSVTRFARNGKPLISESDQDRINEQTLCSRIRAVLAIADTKGVDTLILGAFGCGVFGQNPHQVATIFKNELASGHYRFKTVVFSIMDPNSVNYRAFFAEFSKKSA